MVKIGKGTQNTMESMSLIFEKDKRIKELEIYVITQAFPITHQMVEEQQKLAEESIGEQGDI